MVIDVHNVIGLVTCLKNYVISMTTTSAIGCQTIQDAEEYR